MLRALFPSTADPGAGNFLRDELSASVGMLSARLRPPVAHYLRSAPMFLAWMELTEDLLDATVRVPGGSAINSDGVYYWRLDTAHYVERYGISVSTDFLAHVELCNWVPQELDEITFLEIYEELEQIMKLHASYHAIDSSLRTFYPEQT